VRPKLQASSFVAIFVYTITVLLLSTGLFDFLSDDAARRAFSSLVRHSRSCPVALLNHTPASGSRSYVETSVFNSFLASVPANCQVLVDVEPERLPRVLADSRLHIRPRGQPPLAHSDQLLREIPDELPAHVTSCMGAMSTSLGRPWWAIFPFFDSRALLDPSIGGWLQSKADLKAVLADGGSLDFDGCDVVVLGDVEALGRVLTYSGQMSETEIIAILVASSLTGRVISQPSRLFLLVVACVLGALLGMVRSRFGAWTAAGVLVIALFAIPGACAAAVARIALWVDPIPLQALLLVGLVAPGAPGAAGAQSSPGAAGALSAHGAAGALNAQGVLALARVRELWAASDLEALDAAISSLDATSPEAARLWRVIAEQAKAKSERIVDLSELALHLMGVEDLYALGRVYERYYHWNEALVAYDWAVLKRMDYQDLSKRRREVKSAVLGNLEFLDVEELTANIDGRYEKLEMLGQGGMGLVLKGWDSYLERTVAVKLVQPACLTNVSAIERFQQEIEILSGLNHPNIVQIYTVHRSVDCFYYTMELLEGQDLKLADGLGTRLGYLAVLARALEYVHERGICHRDLKPDNVLIVEGRGPVLIDFGVSRIQAGDRLTQAGEIVGTLAYMAPELVGGAEASCSTDIFAFGVVMYELFCGKLPFSNPMSLKKAPPEFLDELPERLQELITACMNVDPDSRPKSFLALSEVLDELSQKDF